MNSYLNGEIACTVTGPRYWRMEWTDFFHSAFTLILTTQSSFHYEPIYSVIFLLWQITISTYKTNIVFCVWGFKKKSNHKMAAGEKINIVSFALYTIKGELFAYFLSCAFFICFLYITKRTMTPKISEFLIRRIFRMCVLLFTGKYYLHNMSDSNHLQIWLLSLNVLDSQPVNVKISYILLHFDQLT